MKTCVRMPLKTAKKLFQQEFGLSGSSLIKEIAEGDVYIYKTNLGRFSITVENDWSERNGLFRIRLSSQMGEDMQLYYDPVSLQENDEAGDKNRSALRQEYCEGCTKAQNKIK